MFTAVQDIHHRNRQNAGVDAADVFIERQADEISRRPSYSQGNAESCISAEFGFVGCSIESNHKIVDPSLIQNIFADDFGGNDVVDILHGF